MNMITIMTLIDNSTYNTVTFIIIRIMNNLIIIVMKLRYIDMRKSIMRTRQEEQARQ